jgi:hypothetical protein
MWSVLVTLTGNKIKLWENRGETDLVALQRARSRFQNDYYNYYSWIDLCVR